METEGWETEGWDDDKSRLVVGMGLLLEGTGGPGRQPLLWGGRPAGNPFEAARDLPREGHNGAVGTDGKAEPPRREPVADRHGADHADQGAGRDIARMMREQHEARQQDHDCVVNMNTRSRGHSAETANASANAVTAWPDGRLA